jgi:hypothetical protein
VGAFQKSHGTHASVYRPAYPGTQTLHK